MFRYLVARIASLLPVLIGVTLVASLLVEIVPGDPVTAMAGDRASPEVLDRIRADLGLDRPFLVRYLHDVGRWLRGDLGTSYLKNRPVLESLRERLPNTLLLALSAMVIATLLGVLIGSLSAVFRNSWFDRLVTTLVVFGISAPVFLVGLAAIYVFRVRLGWVHSISGFETWENLLLPAVTLSTQSIALIARVTRSAILDVLPQEFVKVARAKGISEARVFFRHVLPNASLPILTVIGLDLGSYLNGSVITETVFSWPGIGLFMYQDGILPRDIPVIQGMVIFSSLLFIACNLVVDLLYVWIDPRLRARVAES